jgi:hypothetical protein
MVLLRLVRGDGIADSEEEHGHLLSAHGMMTEALGAPSPFGALNHLAWREEEPGSHAMTFCALIQNSI